VRKLGKRLAAALLGVLVIAGLLSGDDDRTRSPTSFGRGIDGYGAAYDLLGELRLPVERSYVHPARLPPGATVWWIAPGDLCPAPAEAGGSDSGAPVDDRRRPARIARPCLDPSNWLTAGGIGVVFLGRDHLHVPRTIGSVPVPRRASDVEAEATEEEARAKTKPDSAGEDESGREPDPSDACHSSARYVLEGALVGEPMRLYAPGLDSFAELDEDWTIAARLAGEPFVIERQMGSGRLVLVADSSFLENLWLDSLDSAPLAIDLVRRFGVPRIDERAHGYGPHRSALTYLAQSSALPFFIGLLLLSVTFAWNAAALPSRTLVASGGSGPTLAAFVDSMAAFYTAARDHSRVLDCYREATASRLRRRFGLPPETRMGTLVERLRSTAGVDADALALLERGRSVHGATELREAFAELDRIKSPKGDIALRGRSHDEGSR
jgi:hypothetical protein